SLARHFIYDIFHFDGKFFDTLKFLLLNPGKVPKEYISGRRMHYLDPIRMYLFTSAVFFLIFFSVNDIKVGNDKEWTGRLSRKDRMELAMELQAKAKSNQASPFERAAIPLLLDSTIKITVDKDIDSTHQDSIVRFKGTSYLFIPRKESTIQAIDSALKKKNWLTRQIMRKVTNVDRRVDDGDAGKTIIEQFLHRLPYLLFVSLPFFALILKLLYYRRKQFFYSDHIVFTLYHYIFSFLLLLLMLGSVRLADWTKWSVFGWVTAGLGIWWAIYLYKGMRQFYEQRRGKTIGKFVLLNLLGFVAIMFLLLLFIVFTAIQL
ncbi:MAG: hypothetical protein JWP88_1358, partial [Flaviaesturariibacter sp.]|nr:hypothetical protein [Flaviaesturariibacter sp.]